MASLGKQFTLLLWKNFVLQKRKKCVTVFEIIVPLFFALILLIIRGVTESTYVDKDTTFDKLSPSEYTLNGTKANRSKTIIYYTPNTVVTTDLMTKVQAAISLSSVVGFNSEAELIASYKTTDGVWAGVVFDGDYSSTLPATVQYHLRVALREKEEDRDRWRTDQTYQIFSTFGPRTDGKKPGMPYYFDTGFLTLQYEVDKAIIETKASITFDNDYVFALQKMPFLPHLKDVLTTVLSTNLPLFIVLSFILNALQIGKNIAYEKEKKLKEAMKMMGLSNLMYWLSWFVKCLIYLTIVMLVYTILISIPVGQKGKVLNFTQPTLLFVFLFCYAIATIAFCFMISTFFSKANSAAFGTGILFFATYFPYFFLSSRYEDMGQGEKMAACLLSNVAMAFGCNVITIYEGTGEGAQWNNFYRPGTVDDNFSLLDAIIMLLVDTVLYMIIAWYVDTINPGDAGIAQPPWFPFKPSYWCGSKKVLDDYCDDLAASNHGSDNFERGPDGLKPGISIKNLKKVFDKKVAVKGTSLNMFEGQITALLGHNGAGKTTTISMLTGFLEPTGGTALVNGYDIRTDISKVRKTLGLCPQHNILFDLMTVKEHLIFFAELKGCPKEKVTAEVEEMIRVLELGHKTDALSQTLSGGQKRKLSVGIALIAGSQTVILDEPTSGMDPAARRQTWNILQTFRSGRTIILTTHFMDEADILGDRIAIMAEGVVKCCGTSLFLKKLYGAGYHMVCVKGKSCNTDNLTKMVQSYIPTAVLESEISAEISYLLPFDQSDKFQNLFSNVENKMAELGITSFGTSATTMEEVFLKVGEGNEDDENDKQEVPNKKQRSGFQNPNYGSTKEAFVHEQGASSTVPKLPQINGAHKEDYQNNAYIDTEATETVVPMNNISNGNYISYNQGIRKNEGMSLALQQFAGMFIKKIIHTWRNRVVTIVQLLLPVVFTIFGLLIEKTLPEYGDEPELYLNLDPFTDPITAYSDGTIASTKTDTTPLVTAYKNQFSNPVSVNRGTYSTMDAYFLAEQNEDGMSTFNSRYIVGGDYEQDSKINVTSHFNGQPFHASAIALHYSMNSILKKHVPTASIITSNYPFPKKLEDATRVLFFSTNGTAFTIAICVLFGMAFMATSFIIFLIKERSVGAKHLQVVSGVGPMSFWFSAFLWDIINYTLPVLLMLVVFAAFQTDAYVQDGRLGIVFLILMLYGWSVLPFVYLLHYLFKTPATGMVVVSMINLLTGLVFLLTVYTLSIPQLGTEDISKALEWVFIIFLPNFDLGQALMDMYTNAGYQDTCNSYNYKVLCAQPNASFSCCFPDNCGGTCFTFYENFLAWDKPGVGRHCVFMALQGFIYFAMVFMAENGIFARIWYRISSSKSASVGSTEDLHGWVNPASPQTKEEDSDVAEERRRINTTSTQNLMQTDSLILKNVSKVYGSFRAVKGICVGVPADECFGLLGQNGAGKTTTFKMMTGDEILTSGNAYLKKYSVKSNIKDVQKNLGYCPQFDALIDQMTGRETLRMYARLRGVDESQIENVIKQLIDILMLRKHADKQVGFYSGGNKRKLSTAIALIGDPPFIFLDEPTTGMDPGARRQLWNVLSEVRASGRTLVLTSHSMEECDALCTRIVIMVNGEFVCLGSPQHLKNKFGHGYTLFCRMGLTEAGETDNGSALIEFIKHTFPSSEVFADNQGYVHFQIPDESVKLAQIFGTMEQAKKDFNVDDYSVHQTTLEQIFLTFTQHQVPPIEKESKKCCSSLCCC